MSEPDEQTAVLISNHSANVNLLTDRLDHSKSIYATATDDPDACHYARRVNALYAKLGIDTINGSPIWATPLEGDHNLLESERKIEWKFEVTPNHILAYVQDASWNRYREGVAGLSDVMTSLSFQDWDSYSVLVRSPLSVEQIHTVRAYHPVGAFKKTSCEPIGEVLREESNHLQEDIWRLLEAYRNFRE